MKKCNFCHKCGHIFPLEVIDQEFECGKYNYVETLPKGNSREKVTGATWIRNKNVKIEVIYDDFGHIIEKFENGKQKTLWRKRE